MRPDPDRLLAETARALKANELLAVLNAACDARDRGSLDALRCRNLVFGGANAMAREAALDMAREGLGEGARRRIETVVTRHVRAAIEAGLADDPTMPALLDAALAPKGIEPGTTGGIRERRLDRCLASGDMSGAVLLLADGAGLDPTSVKDAVERRDAKALVSLVWKAGYDQALATPVQIVLGRTPPDGIADVVGEDGFPFRRAEMQWESEGFRRA